MKHRGILAAAALLMLSGRPAAAQSLATQQFRIFMPAFGGEQPLGLHVATIVNLRIWRTLRKAPSPNPGNVSFGDGGVLWDTKPISEPTALTAQRALRFTDSDMVLWGAAERYGDGAIASTFLLVRQLKETDAPRGALWQISVAGHRIELGLPRHMFEFGTIALGPDALARFSRPSLLTLCPTRTTVCEGKPIGPTYRAVQHEGDWTRVTSPTGGSGWVHLEQLGDQPTETVEFTGALASYFRGDLTQAERLFARVASTAGADSIAREDAKALRAAALSRMGAPAGELIDRLIADDPYSRYALQIAVMDALQRLSGDNAPDRLRRLAADVRGSQDLFENGDPWLVDAETIFASLGI